MKKTLLIISILSTFIANGQTSVYRPFPTDQGNWVYLYYDDFGVPTSMFSEYTLYGDTTISSTTYKKIYSNSIYLGAIRETAKIIYFVPDTTTNEYVLYDFNLNLGDTIIHPYGGAVCSNDTITIDYIDSVQSSDGYHRQLHLSSYATWIEGVGSTAYLLEPANILCVSGNYALQCMVNDSSFIHPWNVSTCFLSLEETFLTNQNISVVPNPSSGKFSIISDKSIKEIYLTDLLGNVILRQQINYQTKFQIDNLNTGVYILSAIDIDNKTRNVKIVSSY